MGTTWILVVAAAVTTSGCAASDGGPGSRGAGPLDAAAQQYVRLALALDRHDPDFVDAYWGAEAVRDEAAASWPDRGAIRKGISTALASLADLPDLAHEDDRRRAAFLRGQLVAMRARLDVLDGRPRSFDAESQDLLGTVAPPADVGELAARLDELARRIPGDAPLADRYAAYRARFIVPRDRVPAVFERALAACRTRTREHLSLPDGEQIQVQYVTRRPWAASTRYLGGGRSLVQVNVGSPVTIDSMVTLACHEGYPGHHVQHVLQDRALVRARGWPEFELLALFTPQSLVAEGAADAGVKLAFPPDARLALERDELFPVAGLDPADAAPYAGIQRLVEALEPAADDLARRYLDGRIDRAGAADWLRTHTLMPDPEGALDFIDRYRSYVIAYHAGERVVENAMTGGRRLEEGESWSALARVITTPWAPDLDRQDGAR